LKSSSTAAYLNSAFKYNFTTERPNLVLRKIDQSGYSFPSGHAQGSTAFWGYLALHSKRKWVYAAAGVLLILVSFSRIYLGVHFPVDIAGGIAIGLVLLAFFETLRRRTSLSLEGSAYYLLTAGVVLLLYLNHSLGYGPMTTGFALGALWGYRLEKDLVGWEEKGDWWQQRVTPEQEEVLFSFLTFCRYLVMGLWGPWPLRGCSSYFGCPDRFTEIHACFP